MCTVTYVPNNKGYFLTSNRDEKNTRSTAIEPKEYCIANNNLIFPKDADANGSWIVLKENGDSLCLLNGAFVNFIAKNTYRKSRGIIVLEIAYSDNLIETFRKIDLDNIAPFTLVIVQNSDLYECRWDATSKHIQELNNTLPYIWSSVTLYDETKREIRQNWFSNFIQNNAFINQEAIFNFHNTTGDGNVENNLVMNREDKYFTVSITSVVVMPEYIQMQYKNLLADKITTAKFKNVFAQI